MRKSCDFSGSTIHPSLVDILSLSKNEAMIWLSNYFPHCMIWLFKKTSHNLDLFSNPLTRFDFPKKKPWFGLANIFHITGLDIPKNKSRVRFDLAILSRIADLPFHQMQVTTMKKQKGNPSKDYQLLFYRRPIPAAAASARGINALPF
jgi:hypothetical protein